MHIWVSEYAIEDNRSGSGCVPESSSEDNTACFTSNSFRTPLIFNSKKTSLQPQAKWDTSRISPPLACSPSSRKKIPLTSLLPFFTSLSHQKPSATTHNAPPCFLQKLPPFLFFLLPLYPKKPKKALPPSHTLLLLKRHPSLFLQLACPRLTAAALLSK